MFTHSQSSHKLHVTKWLFCFLALQSDWQCVPVRWVFPCFPLSKGFSYEPWGKMLRMVTSPPACRPRDQRHHHSQHLPTRPDLCHTFINGNKMRQCEWSLFLAVKDAGRKGIFATFSLHILTLRKVHCLFQPNWVTWPLIMYIHIIWFYIFFYVYIYFEIIYFSILHHKHYM